MALQNGRLLGEKMLFLKVGCGGALAPHFFEQKPLGLQNWRCPKRRLNAKVLKSWVFYVPEPVPRNAT